MPNHVKFLISVLGLFLLITTSCRKHVDQIQFQTCKSSCFIIHGKVYDANNQVPVQAEVEIIRYNPGSYEPPWVLGNAKCNPDGTFDIRFDGPYFIGGNSYFKLNARKEGYLLTEYDGTAHLYKMDSSKLDIPQQVDIPILPKATLEFLFDINDTSSLESLTYAYQFAHQKYIHSGFLEGWTKDKIFPHPVAGDQFVHTWIDYKINQKAPVTIQDSIYLKKGAVHQINTIIP